MTDTDAVSAQLARWREMVDAATPGPWEAEYDEGSWVHPAFCHVNGWTDHGDDVLCLAQGDAAFIAESRTALPLLLDALEVAVGQIERVAIDDEDIVEAYAAIAATLEGADDD